MAREFMILTNYSKFTLNISAHDVMSNINEEIYEYDYPPYYRYKTQWLIFENLPIRNVLSLIYATDYKYLYFYNLIATDVYMRELYIIWKCTLTTFPKEIIKHILHFLLE